MYIDWIAAFIGFYGTYLLRKKSKYGFALLTVMSVLWFFVALELSAHGLLLSSFVFIFLNLHGFWEWNKEEKIK